MLSERQRLRAGVAIVVGVALAIGVIAVGAQRALTAGDTRRVERIGRELLDANDLRLHIERKAAWVRAYLATGDESYLTKVDEADKALRAAITRLDEGGAEDMPALTRLTAEHQQAVTMAIQSRQRGDTPDEVELFAGSEARTHQLALDVALKDFVALREKELASARTRASRKATVAAALNIAITAAALGLAMGMVMLLLRMLKLERERGREMEEANRELDAFAGRIAHDLKNALAPAIFAVGCLNESRDADAKKFGAVIERVVMRANGMIGGLLAFARTVSQPADTNAIASVADTIRDVREEHLEAIVRTDVTLDVSVDESRVKIGGGLLHVVLSNLVGNAVKFIEGRAHRRVRVNVRSNDDSVDILVEDSGPGIPESSLAKIFDPFYRVPGVKAPGSGIGLATVKRVVESHGGSIEVRSVVGAGTTVRVRLPRAIPPPVVVGVDEPAESEPHAAEG